MEFFFVSIANCFYCGKNWNETKQNGGWPHLVNWSAAIMSAAGFTWCYSVVLGLLGMYIPIIENPEGVMVPTLTFVHFQVLMDLSYLFVILPVIATGSIITIESWKIYLKNKTFSNGLNAGINTAIDINNIYGAVKYIPSSFDDTKDFFSSDTDDLKESIILALLVIAIGGGVYTAYKIITSVAKKEAMNKRFEMELKELA